MLLSGKFAFIISMSLIECTERKAGLVVLPPLVIGYEDLIAEDTQESIKKLDTSFLDTVMEGDTMDTEVLKGKGNVNGANRMPRNEIGFGPQ
ncbi:unnamed protein product, partial [Iphiclides podalirius]